MKTARTEPADRRSIMIRLQKYLAICGIASRRTSEKIILDGRVAVNGEIVSEMGV